MSARDEQNALSTARRLDGRQRAILRALFDHKLLLTRQIEILFFNSARRCQDVLRQLAEHRLIERDHPTEQIGVGKAQGHWTLSELGVQAVAVMARKPRSQIDWMPRLAWHENDRILDHQLGVNRFFVSLVDASLQIPGHGLEKWIPERYAKTGQAGAWIKHDGFGRYQHPVGACEFYLEFDRATEWSRQLQKKLHGYLQVAELWGSEDRRHPFNLLVVVPTEARERAFDKALRDLLDSLQVPAAKAADLAFFVASDDLIQREGILGCIWRSFAPAPANSPHLPAERHSLVELPVVAPGPYDLAECLGRKWKDKTAKTRRRPPQATYPVGAPPEVPKESPRHRPSVGGEAA